MYRRTLANGWMDIIMCHNIRAVGAPPHWGGVGWTLCTDGLALISSHVFCDYVQRYCLGILSKCVLGSLAHWVSLVMVGRCAKFCSCITTMVGVQRYRYEKFGGLEASLLEGRGLFAPKSLPMSLTCYSAKFSSTHAISLLPAI